MVFFGGTTVFTKALGDVSETPIDKMILICTLCGLIIFDIIFMFLYFCRNCWIGIYLQLQNLFIGKI